MGLLKPNNTKQWGKKIVISRKSKNMQNSKAVWYNVKATTVPLKFDISYWVKFTQPTWGI